MNVPPALDEPTECVPLMQGDVYCTADPKILITVLGSCVAVCLWDKHRRFGGMNHFVLPEDRKQERTGRYGDSSIDWLVAGLVRLGSNARDLEAKVFGGAAVLPFHGGRSVGACNVDIAMERLRAHGIPVAARRTGGTEGLQIRFSTWTGEVLFRPLSANGHAVTI